MSLADSPIRVLLVEDHPVVAEGLHALLEEYDDVHVVGWAPTAAAAAATAGQARPDVALVHFRLPDGSSADTAASDQGEVQRPIALIRSRRRRPR